MKYNRYIITEKDFKKYGIESHYDLSLSMKDVLANLPRRRRTKGNSAPSMGGKRRGTKSTRKGVSTIKGKSSGRILKGFASTQHKDRAMDVISLDALEGAVDDLIQPGANTVFLNHDTDKPIGRVLKTSIKNGGLFVEIMISKASDVEDTWIKIQEGILNSFSIRLVPKKVEVVENAETGQIEQFTILLMELFEVSVVGIPCNTKCGVTSVTGKSFKHSIRKLNNTKTRSRTMKGNTSKNATRRKNRRTSASKGLSPEAKQEVADMLKEANTGLLGELKGMLSGNTDNAKAKAKSARIKARKLARAKADKSSGKTESTPEVQALTDLVKGVQGTMDTLNKTMRRSNRRKGLAGNNDNDNDNGIPAKVLKSATDADTLKYVLYAAKHEAVYKELSEDERTIVNGIYIQTMDAVQSNG